MFCTCHKEPPLKTKCLEIHISSNSCLRVRRKLSPSSHNASSRSACPHDLMQIPHACGKRRLKAPLHSAQSPAGFFCPPWEPAKAESKGSTHRCDKIWAYAARPTGQPSFLWAQVRETTHGSLCCNDLWWSFSSQAPVTPSGDKVTQNCMEDKKTWRLQYSEVVSIFERIKDRCYNSTSSEKKCYKAAEPTGRSSTCVF